MSARYVIRDDSEHVLATFTEDSEGNASHYAQCASPGCPVSIQRLNGGSLADGVRAHYRTVHPERNVR